MMGHPYIAIQWLTFQNPLDNGKKYKNPRTTYTYITQLTARIPN